MKSKRVISRVGAAVLGTAALFLARPDAHSQSSMLPPLVVEGHRDAGEASVSTRAMKYLPFDVPPGVTKITIHREYQPSAGQKNTVDFGLFDNRGTQNGFRGWQGGSPGDFVITGEAQTCSPHAIPGPLPAGRWYIAQYYLVSVPSGLGYRYTVTFSTDGPKPPTAFPSPPPYHPGVVRTGPGWYTGNLHLHSIHSDGGRPFVETVGHCAEQGFDFLVSTEHNSTTAHYRFPEAARAYPNLLLLYGDEFTSPGGHAGILGQTPGHWFDFRMDPGDGKLPGVIAEAHREGALFVVNHPFAPCTSCQWRYPETEWNQADAIEVWNGAWTLDDRAAVDLWDRQLKAGQRSLHAFGGTDYHRGNDPLCPAVLVYAANLSAESILAGLRSGHVVLSESARGPRLLLSTPSDPTKLPGDEIRLDKNAVGIDLEARLENASEKEGPLTLRLVWSDGETRLPVTLAAAGSPTIVRYHLPLTAGHRTGGYVRAELLRPGGLNEQVIALTNPLFWKTP